MKRLRDTVGIHSKMDSVAKMVRFKVEQGEKVILFCHHIATAQELTAHLALVLPKARTSPWPESIWKKAWDVALKPVHHEYHDKRLRDTFIQWLCADLICGQTWSWLPEAVSEGSLVDALKNTRGRHPTGPETIAEAAQRLYHTLLQSRSSRAVLKEAEDDPERLPGANGGLRVLGICKPSDECEREIAVHPQPAARHRHFNL